MDQLRVISADSHNDGARRPVAGTSGQGNSGTRRPRCRKPGQAGVRLRGPTASSRFPVRRRVRRRPVRGRTQGSHEQGLRSRAPERLGTRWSASRIRRSTAWRPRCCTPRWACRCFGLPDADLQRACFQSYNDWVAEFCSHAPKRLYGIGLISLEDIDAGVEELERTHARGMRGAMIWGLAARRQTVQQPRVRPVLAGRLGTPHAALAARHHRQEQGEQGRFLADQPVLT